MSGQAGTPRARYFSKEPKESLLIRFSTAARKYWFIYLLAIPGLLFLLVFSYAPMYGVVLAFKDFKMNLGVMGSPWVGLYHYRELFADPAFIQAFKNTVIILTSNLGSDIILNDLEQRRAQGSNELSDEARKQIDLLLKSKFRPEFLNRLDEIVYYKSLTKDEMRKIVDLQLQDLRNRMEEGKHLKLEVTTAAKDFIIDSAYDSVYGARPIKRFIQSRVETLIAKAIIKGGYAEGDTLTVDYDGSALVLR